MKKLVFLTAFLLLAGCSSKDEVEVEYIHENREEIVDKILGNSLSDEETQKIFDSGNSIDVYYERLDENQIKLTVQNNMEYYYTGSVDFEVCPYKLKVTALPSDSYLSQVIECPDFVDDSEYTYEGKLYSRNEENAYSIQYEKVAYEDNEAWFDYALDLSLDEINVDEMRKLTKFIYEENVLSNYDGEMFVGVYPLEPYNETYDENSSEAWNRLDSEYLAGMVWVDTNNAVGEIYDKDGNFVERMNLK